MQRLIRHCFKLTEFYLVVTGDGNVHISQRGVSVAQGNGGDVYV